MAAMYPVTLGLVVVEVEDQIFKLLTVSLQQKQLVGRRRTLQHQGISQYFW